MRKSEGIGIRLTSRQLERLDVLARATGRTRSGLLRRLLELVEVDSRPEMRVDNFMAREGGAQKE